MKNKEIKKGDMSIATVDSKNPTSSIDESLAIIRHKEKDDLEEKLQEYFDNMNSVGLGELLLFGDGIEMFIESEARRNRLLRAVVDVCGYDTPARRFVKMISYEEFRKKNTIGEITALGLRLFLLYQCGVDWLKPNTVII